VYYYYWIFWVEFALDVFLTRSGDEGWIRGGLASASSPARGEKRNQQTLGCKLTHSEQGEHSPFNIQPHAPSSMIGRPIGILTRGAKESIFFNGSLTFKSEEVRRSKGKGVRRLPQSWMREYLFAI
jgi:hypothetical protein